MNSRIKKLLQRGELVLFLGAGASRGCKTTDGNEVPDGQALIDRLALECSISVEDDDNLADIYVAAEKHLGANNRESLFEHLFKNVTPTKELFTLAEIVWPRVYTTNIDDAFQYALSRNSSQIVSMKSRIQNRVPIQPELTHLQIIYLNGFIRNPNDGYIFQLMNM